MVDHRGEELRKAQREAAILRDAFDMHRADGDMEAAWVCRREIRLVKMQEELEEASRRLRQRFIDEWQMVEAQMRQKRDTKLAELEREINLELEQKQKVLLRLKEDRAASEKLYEEELNHMRLDRSRQILLAREQTIKCVQEERQRVRKFRTTDVCWRCTKQGHYARECPQLQCTREFDEMHGGEWHKFGRKGMGKGQSIRPTGRSASSQTVQQE